MMTSKLGRERAMDRERKLLYAATVLGGVLSALVAAQYFNSFGLPSLSEAVAETRACQARLLQVYAICLGPHHSRAAAQHAPLR